MNRFFYTVFVLIVLLLVCSCEPEQSYQIGDVGPAGGYIFYDCDADNRDGNRDGLKSKECGWKYLEAAPADITEDETSTFVFGLYKASSSGPSLFVNGSTYVEGTFSATDGKSTGTAIGTGAANTAKLVNAMGSSAYDLSAQTTAVYAAKLCDDYEVAGFDDWFLPSKDELDKMILALKFRGVGITDDSYWSSSEQPTYPANAYYQYLKSSGSGMVGTNGRTAKLRVRAIRAFL